MNSRDDRLLSALGDWPPYEWTQDVEELWRFPATSLRIDVMLALRAISLSEDTGTFPAADAAEVVSTMNLIGPRLDRRAVPVIEMVLESLWRDGQVGKIHPPSPRVPPTYLMRDAAETAIRWGGPVVLNPLTGQPPLSSGRPPQAAATCEPAEPIRSHHAPATEAQRD